MTGRDQIIGVTGSTETLVLLKEIIIYASVNVAKVSTKIITGGIIHRMCNKDVYIEIARIIGVMKDRMEKIIDGTTNIEMVINMSVQVSE